MTSELADWLKALRLERYLPTFLDHEVELDDLPSLGEADLRELGLPLGPRRRILRALRAGGVEAETASTPGADELRQLTVLFCDLVGSTLLSRRMEPEDYRDLMAAYVETISDCVTSRGGELGSIYGDGALAYFGWPAASEDQAERAVLAALDLSDAVAGLGAPGEALAARIGVATGSVVVGDLVGEARALAGETPNLAARLQSAAEPGGVIVDAATRGLIRRAFRCEGPRAVTLRGFGEPVEAWFVRGASAPGERGGEASSRAAMIGRSRELDRLRAIWRDVRRSGSAAVVQVTGEPGIGKTRLAAEFVRRAGRGASRLRYYASEQHRSTPLHPVIRQIEHAAGLDPREPEEKRRAKLQAALGRACSSPEDLEIVSELLGLGGARTGTLTRDLTPQRRRRLIFDILGRMPEALAAARPLLMLVEDGHWLDPTSRELLDHVASRVAGSPVMVLVTSRTRVDLSRTDEELALRPLSRTDALALARAVLGGTDAPAARLAAVAGRSDGVPLFIEELAGSSVAEGAAGMPTTLQVSLLARLDRCGPTARGIVQAGAVIGREFDRSLLAAAVPVEPSTLRKGVDEAVASGLLQRTGAPDAERYKFRHALLCDAAYATLLRDDRKRLHREVAAALERAGPRDPGTLDLLGRHLAASGQFERAVRTIKIAARRSIANGAFVEGEEQLRRALEHLMKLPPGPARDQQEANLRNALGAVLTGRYGFTARPTIEAFERARTLAEGIDDSGEMLRALWSLGTANLFAGRHRAVSRMVEEAEPIVEANGHLDARLAITVVKGMVALHAGRTREAVRHLEETLALDSRPENDRDRALWYGQSPRVEALGNLALCLTLAGDPARASALSEASLAEAERLSYAPVRLHALGIACQRHWLTGEHDVFARLVEEFDGLAEAQDTPHWRLLGRIYRAMAVAESPGSADISGRLEDFEAAVSDYERSGAGLELPLFRLALARTCAFFGRAAMARGHAAEVLESRIGGGPTWLTPLALRELGELHRADGDLVAARETLERAIAAAGRHEAPLFACRAALSLSVVLAEMGRTAESRLTARNYASVESAAMMLGLSPAVAS